MIIMSGYLGCYSSCGWFGYYYDDNNYHMKNTHYKCQQALELMLEIVILREDALLFSKLALF